MWVFGGVVILVATMVLLAPREAPPPPQPTPAPIPTPVEEWVPPVAPAPSPTPTPTATPTEAPAAPAQPTPAARPTLIPPPTRRPRAQQAPLEPPDCLAYRWGVAAGTPKLGHNLVEIDVTNQCDRAVTKDEMWFEIRAFRHGGLIQTVTAGPFDDARPGQTVIISVDLPGSMDWYDEVRVEPLRN